MTVSEGRPVPPVTRFRVETADPELAAEYQRTMTDFTEDPVVRDGFEFSMDSTVAAPVSFHRFHHSATFRAVAEPPDAFFVLEMLNGSQVRFADSHDDVVAPVMLAPRWSRYQGHWDRHTAFFVSVEPDEVARVGAEISGLRPEQVVFSRMLPVSDAAARYWSGMTAHLRANVLPHDELLANPIIRADVARQLASGLLAVFPNTTQDHHHRTGPDDGGPATLRRALAFIDDNAHRAITLSEIAQAANLSPRGLRQVFRRHRGCTPLEELRRVRMARAHADLQAADPTRGDTVAAIAARWGFTDLGRFSVAYRQIYGRPPGTTLRD